MSSKTHIVGLLTYTCSWAFKMWDFSFPQWLISRLWSACFCYHIVW